jgi:hypothetical protein
MAQLAPNPRLQRTRAAPSPLGCRPLRQRSRPAIHFAAGSYQLLHPHAVGQMLLPKIPLQALHVTCTCPASDMSIHDRCSAVTSEVDTTFSGQSVVAFRHLLDHYGRASDPATPRSDVPSHFSSSKRGTLRARSRTSVWVTLHNEKGRTRDRVRPT